MSIYLRPINSSDRGIKLDNPSQTITNNPLAKCYPRGDVNYCWLPTTSLTSALSLSRALYIPRDLYQKEL